jgi:hypothetical protein
VTSDEITSHLAAWARANPTIAGTDGASIAREAADTQKVLTSWQGSARLVSAVSVVTALDAARLGPTAVTSAPFIFPTDLLALAEAACVWRDREFGHDVPDGTLRLRLRQFLRNSYTQLPNVDLPILLLAMHEARRRLPAAAAMAKWDRLTHAVYLPLAQLFGVYQLRRSWKRQLKLLPPADAPIPIEVAIRDAIDQARFLAKIPYSPTIVRIGGAATEPDHVAPQSHLRVHVTCESTEDCYRLVGAIHQVAKPIHSYKAGGLGMMDYIASPKSSGYRAFITTVQARGTGVAVQFHLCTPEMHELNEWGVVAWNRNPDAYEGLPLWWTSYSALSERLQDSFGYSLGIQRFLADSDHEEEPKAIYAFTPKGQLKLLPPRSTVLDFAYSLHTAIGDEASRFEINGRAVPYHYLVQNGDMVVVHRGPQAALPDLSWLSAVQTKRAHDRIEQRLRYDAAFQHPALAELQSHLIALVRLYRRERQFDLLLNQQRLQWLLTRVAKERRLDRAEQVLDLVSNREISASKLVHRLISEEFGDRLADNRGSIPEIPTWRTSFCQTCRPVPGDTIVGIHNERRRVRRMVVHRTTCDLTAGGADRSIELGWQGSQSSNEELSTFEIRARDRADLLKDILDAISVEALDLYRVEAEVHDDGQADIRVIVGGRTLRRLDGLQLALTNVAEVLQVSSRPTLRRGVPRYTGGDAGYSELHALGPGFYDREEVRAAMVQWVEDPLSQPWLIVHGEGRVGKTSLVLYFADSVAPRERLGEVAYLDAQRLPSFDFESLCRYVANAILHVDTKARSDIDSNTDAADWLLALLERRASESSTERLIIVIDELSWLLDHDTDAVFWGRLRSLMERSGRVRWILVVHDHHYRSRWSDDVGRIFRGPHVHLTHLNSMWARKLITEPITRAGYEIGQGVVDNLLHLTDGNPYLIAVLGRDIIRRARANPRKLVEEADVDRAATFAIEEGARLFWHFDQSILGWSRLVFTALARLQCPRSVRHTHGMAAKAPVTLAAIKTALQRQMPSISETRIEKSALVLEQRNLVSRSKNTLRIPMLLLARWWSTEKMLSKEVAAFQASRAADASAKGNR